MEEKLSLALFAQEVKRTNDTTGRYRPFNLSPASPVASLPNCYEFAIAPKGRSLFHPDGIISPEGR